MALNDEDRVQAEKLLKAYRQRLRYREEQIARLGDTADPAIPIDRDDLEREIGLLEAVLKPDSSPAVAGLIKRRLEDDVFLFQQSVEQNQRITRVEQSQSRMGVQLYEAQKDRMIIHADVADLKRRAQADDYHAERGRRRNYRLLLINVVLLVIIFGGMVWLAAR